ncbi:hypothetical protein TCAL_08052 [Tigriopus californicus]|uniref:Platelet-derived growth factor (PDGF) family profile domain-containing protein n=1 Tax=Tigriopus californicus TaxID=6832 RepID=A0A553NP32_TIGCA|nr:uncharacterized protein LOC131879168 isoform X2 [Tigriopus californicus]TRY67195.1 hypothetical protein TCAL_08052 [Tigriopus californicus]
MIVAMAVNTIFLMSSFILIQQMEMGNSSQSIRYTSEQYLIQEQCPSDLKTKIWREMPHCNPRDILVDLPLPSHLNTVQEVIPPQVMAKRCQGVCAQGNDYHQCVARPEGRFNKTIEVLLLDKNGNYKCGETQVEFHESCKCGCDLEATTCSAVQFYDHGVCKCRCQDIRAHQRCIHYGTKQKFWDESSCRCICRAEMFKACSTGFVYDGLETCSCVPGSSQKAAGIEVLGALIVIIVVLLVGIAILLWRDRRRAKTESQQPTSAEPTEQQRLQDHP